MSNRTSDPTTDAVVSGTPVHRRPFKLILKDVSDGLRTDDLHALKFLCSGSEYIPAAKMENIRTSLDLFEALETLQLIHAPDGTEFLAEILYHVKCHKCLRCLSLTAADVDAHIKQNGVRIDPYRLMLYKVCEGLHGRNIDEIKFLCEGDLSRSALEGIKTSLDLILALEKGGHIAPQELNELIKLLTEANRKDLVKIVSAYQSNKDDNIATATQITNIRLSDTNTNNQSNGKDPTQRSREDLVVAPLAPNNGLAGGQNSLPNNIVTLRPAAPMEDRRLPSRYPQDECHASSYNPPSPHLERALLSGAPPTPPCGGVIASDAGGAPPTNNIPPVLPAQNVVGSTPGTLSATAATAAYVSTMEEYPMTRKPRGLCVIINNEKFKDIAPPESRLEDRTGTDVDKRNLIKLFTFLQFELKVLQDLKATQILQCLSDVSKMDHSNYDCFVCVILSHGMMGTIYGVDGETVEISKFMSFFKRENCASLREKPKVFFLQACQGKKKAEDVGTDGPTDGMEAIPSERDFLLSYSTVPGYVSYRSRSKGSWYIGSLVKKLEELHAKEDLLSILVTVNNDVNKNTAKEKYRQSPAPIFTITKKIYFR